MRSPADTAVRVNSDRKDHDLRQPRHISQIDVITRWTPVKNLTFSADVTYSHLDQKFAGLMSAGAANGVAKPAGLYEAKDQDTVSMLLRAQRNF